MLFISIESCRNGYSHLHSHVPGFVLAHLGFSVEEWDRQESFQVWTSLGLEAELAEELSELAEVG
eukprot:4049158-Prorocentrum_lima.AAC.1